MARGANWMPTDVQTGVDKDEKGPVCGKIDERAWGCVQTVTGMAETGAGGGANEHWQRCSKMWKGVQLVRAGVQMVQRGCKWYSGGANKYGRGTREGGGRIRRTKVEAVGGGGAGSEGEGCFFQSR
jgi:hypothetical protein